MLQAEQPDTFVLATNRTETVRDFVAMAFKATGIEPRFEGKNEQEVGIDVSTNKIVIKVSPKFYRPAEVELLIGNPQREKDILGWEPKTTLQELFAMMFEEELQRYRYQGLHWPLYGIWQRNHPLPDMRFLALAQPLLKFVRANEIKELCRAIT